MAEIRDELASTLADSLSKKFDNSLYVLGDGSDNSASVQHWISTGSPMLDLAISNRPHGGFPCGRIVEITGLEASGKSLVAAHALASCQRDGGVSVLIDTEWTMDENFLRAIGVDLKNLLAAHVDTIETAFEMIENVIEKVRKSDKDRPVCIVLDSIAGASTKSELESTFDKQGYATDKSIIISQALRKITNLIGREKICLICTNQLRQKMNVMFGDPWTTPGGKALAFHASVRVRLASLGQISVTRNKKPMIIGMKTQAQIVKNRVGPPKRKAQFDIFFDRGIDDTPQWLGRLEDLKIISKSGQKYTLLEDKHGQLVVPSKGKPVEYGKPDFEKYMEETEDGDKDARRERIEFKSKDFYGLLAKKAYFDFIYDRICDAEIMKYRNAEEQDGDDFDPDELIHEDENGEIITND